MNTEVGIIKHLSDKGFGFIQRESGDSLYFHASKCGNLWVREKPCQLKKGMKVSFVLGTSIKGTPEAQEIALVSKDDLDIVP